MPAVTPRLTIGDARFADVATPFAPILSVRAKLLRSGATTIRGRSGTGGGCCSFCRDRSDGATGDVVVCLGETIMATAVVLASGCVLSSTTHSKSGLEE